MYTKEQLIKGMELYYQNNFDTPDEFEDTSIDDIKESAIKTIEYLISLIDNAK